MSKLLMIAGILAAALGVALGIMVLFPTSQSSLLIYGFNMETAVTLLVGGLGLLGLGGIIDATDKSGRAVRDLREWLAGHEGSLAVHHEPPAPAPARVAEVAAVAATVVAAVEEKVEVTKVTTAETIAALEKAKADISEALGEKAEDIVEAIEEPKATAEEDEEEPKVEPGEVHGEEDDDSDLYVTEEKTIRGRPARVLSDGTVEAETDEGWMRFENLEHLEEYLDAVSPQANRNA